MLLSLGAQKINIHVEGRECEPKAYLPDPSALNLCFMADRPLEEIIAHLAAPGASIIEGPIARTGVTGSIRSLYLPD